MIQAIKTLEESGETENAETARLELSQPEINPDLYELVDTFWACRTGDGVTMEGLKAYSDMTGYVLTAASIRFIRAMDATASKWISTRIKNDSKPDVSNSPPQGGGKRKR